MEWLLMILMALAIFLNIRAVIAIKRTQQEKQKLRNDLDHINRVMEEFVEKIEKENDVLYQKMIEYIKRKEGHAEKRMHDLEQRLGKDTKRFPNEKEALGFDPTGNQNNHYFPEKHETLNSKALALYRQGFSSKQIAKILKIENGKVELMINMQKKRKAINDEMK